MLMRNHKIHTNTPFSGGLEVTIDNARVITGLSKTASRLYMFIRESSVRNNGIIIFNFKAAKSTCGFKQDKSVYNALSELINKDILAGREESDEFYYNPKFINNKKEL